METALEASPGERLRTLRDLLGLTQADLSRSSGMSQAWISHVETGTRIPSDEGLQAISAATGTPISFFSVRPNSAPLGTLQFRKLSSAGATSTRRVRAYFGESYRVAEALVRHEKYPSPPLPYATKEDISVDEIESLASETREVLQIAPDKPIPHLTRALERCGVAVVPIVLPDPDGEGQEDAGKNFEPSSTTKHFGVSYWGGIGELALIGFFPGSQGDRDRFTLAHEVGHLVLHTFRPKAQDPEVEANLFASALLVPYERARADLTARLNLTGYARLKATWGVSIQALIMRGAAVGNITESRKRSLFVQLTQRGWRKVEPVSVGNEEPLLLQTLLTRWFGDRPYLPASEVLAINSSILRSIAPVVARDRYTSNGENSPAQVVQLRRSEEKQDSARPNPPESLAR